MTFEQAENKLRGMAGPKSCHLKYGRSYYVSGAVAQECTLYIEGVGMVDAESWTRAFELLYAKRNGDTVPLDTPPTGEPEVIKELLAAAPEPIRGTPTPEPVPESVKEILKCLPRPMCKMNRAAVVQLLSEQLGINKEQCTDDASLVDDLGCDSLDLVELTMAFEEELQADISDEIADTVKTVGDIVALLKRAQGWQE
jgi:acyl carrier protein